MNKSDREMKYFQWIHEAEKAGNEAAKEAAKHLKSYAIMQNGVQIDTLHGLCGFAWVKIKNGKSSLARFMVKEKLADKGTYGGVEVWVGVGGQSVDIKSAYARAYARKLSELSGEEAVGQSRLD